MSRRRPTPKLPDGARKIRVVCTDKGQHAEVSFGHVVVDAMSNGKLRVNPFLQHRGDEYVEAVGDPDRQPLPDPVRKLPDRLRHTYPLKCRRCGRDTPLRIDTLERIVRAGSDMRKLDISDMS